MRSGALTDGRWKCFGSRCRTRDLGCLRVRLHCPSDDPFYIAIWYSLSCAIVVGVVRSLLPRVAHW
ncbi:NrsF family protein [Sphingomonas echinoides]|jgi:hypothetical protein|uniref:NrsF family protein n=1 Tax=Sphingomonas echinoides TaxID=59803 RepID=UPI003F4C40EE